jgi:hypothetical protein
VATVLADVAEAQRRVGAGSLALPRLRI